MFGERSLNFLELHPESPYLDLIIDPADEIECSVGPKPDQIAGPVYTLRNAIASIELDESGKRQVRVAAISAGQSIASNQQFSRGARLSYGAVQSGYESPNVRQRVSDRHGHATIVD